MTICTIAGIDTERHITSYPPVNGRYSSANVIYGLITSTYNLSPKQRAAPPQ
ncbi:hypothetical protein COLSTE_00827 [Collinsella stercoris DSM 13279]|uniref:Uncharacterized protein n=1 Tax=Collinsella stercoris DSM 13279 TaxID=445975 RepID=B6G9T6_9ACTN|nr:hypothetical protein COLSTE_00827 [Collinsella stercoris DSM 13279]